MTDIVHVSHNASTALESTNGFRDALAVADTMRADLALAGDWHTLASALNYLKDLKRDLDTLIRATEDDIVGLLPDKKVVVEGIGTLEKKSVVTRKWESEDLLKYLCRTTLDPDGTGEIDPSNVVKLMDVLRKVLPLTSSLGWRATALKDLGVDDEQFCEKTYGRTGLAVTK